MGPTIIKNVVYVTMIEVKWKCGDSVTFEDTSDFAIGEQRKKRHTATLEENKTRACRVRGSYESVSKVYPTSSIQNLTMPWQIYILFMQGSSLRKYNSPWLGCLGKNAEL